MLVRVLRQLKNYRQFPKNIVRETFLGVVEHDVLPDKHPHAHAREVEPGQHRPLSGRQEGPPSGARSTPHAPFSSKLETTGPRQVDKRGPRQVQIRQ